MYHPLEDSYLFQKNLKKYLKNKSKKIKIIDMGSGTGFQALACKNLGFSNILVSDINPESVSHLKNLGFKAKKSNLFSNIRGKFDLIIFNPPYLPEDKREPKDSKINTTSGKEGYELIVKFLKQAKNNLNINGKILLLFSSLSKPEIIFKEAKKLNYFYNLLDKQKLFFEELYVYEFKSN